ncbi:hypothetical protein H2199_004187 [Coniosporium tulheliwenetii]|uniref:Uncharacterized protein n=1 Tax=Coniosporium tulheliwenetii TaxID=3383036 RepID=A0ACC2Z791_9PEZI|nr:hypothetical protein H2199_004187 [Cladosporium sp. JES 115]
MVRSMALRLLGLLVSLFFAEMVSAAPTNTVDGIYATSTPLCPATGPNNNGTIWVGANGYHYMIACDRMYVGGDLAAPTGHTDLSTCLAACENYANRACVAATFDAEAGGVNVPNAAGTCHLKSYAFTPLIADTKKDGAFCRIGYQWRRQRLGILERSPPAGRSGGSAFSYDDHNHDYNAFSYKNHNHNHDCSGYYDNNDYTFSNYN